MFAVSCSSITGQTNEADLKKEEDFMKAIDAANSAIKKSREVGQIMNERTNVIVVQATKKIVTLQKEVKQLKKNLHEVTKVSRVNDGSQPFTLLPISDSSEIW